MEDAFRDGRGSAKVGCMIKRLIHFLFVLIVLGLLAGIPCLWMVRRSYSDPEVHYFYTSENSEKSESGSSDSLRFAVMTDLYSYVFEGGNGVISDLVGSTFPDAILIGGNLIGKDTMDITQITDLIKKLSSIAPVYYSYGEQELEYVRKQIGDNAGAEAADPLREALEKAGAIVLNEEFKDTKLYGVDVRIGGMTENAYNMTGPQGEVKKDCEKTYSFLNEYQNTESLKIMMSIRPESFLFGDACEKWNIDYVVSGNELGGLVVLPHYGPVFSQSQGRFPEYIHGLYEKGNIRMLITSGLSAPKSRIPRFNNPPEIAVLDIDGLQRSAQ